MLQLSQKRIAGGSNTRRTLILASRFQRGTLPLGQLSTRGERETRSPHSASAQRLAAAPGALAGSLSVRREGVEPSRPSGHTGLSRARLPFQPPARIGPVSEGTARASCSARYGPHHCERPTRFELALRPWQDRVLTVDTTVACIEPPVRFELTPSRLPNGRSTAGATGAWSRPPVPTRTSRFTGPRPQSCATALCPRCDSNAHCRRTQRRASCRWATRTKSLSSVSS